MIKELILQRINIPFRATFKHANAERSETESIWVEARSNSGLQGFGESCPRIYVTGETIESVTTFFFSIKEKVVLEIQIQYDLHEWVQQNQCLIDANPAAWCAIELALLDLFAKEVGEPVEALLSMPKLQKTFQYSAVVGDNPLDVFQAQMNQYLSLGFQNIKVKISGDLARDKAKLDWLQESAGRVLHVRVDANNLWETPQQCIDYIRALEYTFMAIEEPLQPNQYDGLAQVAATLKMPVILDESFVRYEQFDRLSSAPDRWIINLRVSKMGGLIRSKAIVDIAKRKGIPIIVGAQVGETSLLTRAGISMGNYAKSILLAQEGAFGSYLLKQDICHPPLMFGAKGVLDLSKYKFNHSHGFGLDVTEGLSFLEALPTPVEREAKT